MRVGSLPGREGKGSVIIVAGPQAPCQQQEAKRARRPMASKVHGSSSVEGLPSVLLPPRCLKQMIPIFYLLADY